MTAALCWDERTALGARVLEIRGALIFPDSRLVAERLSALVRSGARRIVLDVSHATEMDSAIVGVLLAAARQLRWVDGRLAIVTADEHVVGVLRTTGLDRVVDVVPSQAAALRPDVPPRRRRGPGRAATEADLAATGRPG